MIVTVTVIPIVMTTILLVTTTIVVTVTITIIMSTFGEFFWQKTAICERQRIVSALQDASALSQMWRCQSVVRWGELC